MMSFLITAIVLAKNEEKHIAECIKSLSFCDEILVINDHSTDKTEEIINKLGNKRVKVISHSLNDDFSQSRNFGLEKAQNEWILFIDSDEQVSAPLAFEVSNVMNDEYDGFYMKRFDFIWGKELKHGESGIKLLRLAKKNSGRWIGKVHEKWKIKGKIGVLKNSIVHYPHQTTEEFLREINFYTDVRAKELYEKNIKVPWWSIVFYPISKFIQNFFLRRGFLDGVHGLVFAMMMSFHSFLVRGKLWLLMKK